MKEPKAIPPRPVRFPPEVRGALGRLAGLRPEPVWLVGGSLRDVLLGRPLFDLDVACARARGLAQAAARAFGGAFVVLDEENGVYRVALKPEKGTGALRQIDVAEIQGRGIEQDLARRDFTVNALALPLSPAMAASVASGALLDPRRGLDDLRRRVLRCEEDRLIKEDPLRLLRAFRLAAQCGLTIEPRTLARLRRFRGLARDPAPERAQAELMALLAVPGAPEWLALMDRVGLLTAVLPDLEPSRRCAAEYYGPGGVLKHSLDVCRRLDFLLSHFKTLYPDLARAFAEAAPPRATLMLAALLHDVAKPACARRVGGRLRFFGHDERGADSAAALLRALRLSGETVASVAAVVRQHLRPGHMANSGGITEKAAYRFFRDLGKDAPALLAVAWSDHASYLPEATLKRLLPAACARRPGPLDRVRPPDARKTVGHLRVVSELLRRGFSREAPVPARILDGNDVMKALGLAPGPRVGEALERLREAQAEGRVKDRAQALAFVSRLGKS